MDFSQEYNRQNFIEFFSNKFLPEDFLHEVQTIELDFSSKYFQQVTFLGNCPSLDLSIYEVKHSSEYDARVSLSRDSFKLISRYDTNNALILFVPGNAILFRLSLVTIQPKLDEKGIKIKREYSNPKRYSFLLGEGSKINTPTQFLIHRGRIVNLDDLKNRFSVEVVNREFYTRIAEQFSKLVGGKRKRGSKTIIYDRHLVLPSDFSENDQKYKEFAVRLIGRTIFCWFLKMKKSKNGIPLIDNDVLSSFAVGFNPNYYHEKVEPLFFEVLNTPIQDRKEKYRQAPYNITPFLNGGLFEPHYDDYYELNNITSISCHINTLKVPDKWWTEFLSILELYNFTIDENTSVDIDLSVDPEMLGRVFENLLAEINPETGKTARKSTGSYYTPRPIVEYMVDQSLIQFLITKTKIEKSRISKLLDYSIEESGLNSEERKMISNVIYSSKILDPACGSGAFPMGMLQKILLILQKVDSTAENSIETILKEIKDPIKRNLIANKIKAVQIEDDTDFSDYARKLSVIQNSIYGIDIQPIATEISKLRFFLSLIVDEVIQDNNPNRGIEPLPNLEFKFVCANTLISLPEKDVNKNLFEDEDNISALERIREDYFVSYGEHKDKLREDFSKVQKRMFQQHLSNINAFIDNINTQTARLINWKPFKDEAANWFDPKWMFGIDSGFDLIIGNPPYLGQKGNKEVFQEIQKSPLGEKYHQRRMDLFYFFIHFSIIHVKPRGIVSFITTNYYPTATYSDKLRKHLAEEMTCMQFVDFNELKVFESASGQHNLISMFQKIKVDGYKCKIIQVNKVGIATAFELSNILTGTAESATSFYKRSNEIFEEETNYIRISDNSSESQEGKIIETLEVLKKTGVPIGDYFNVEQGIVSGADKVTDNLIRKYPQIDITKDEGIYILSNEEVDNLCLDQETVDQYIKKTYKNSDIKRWYFNPQDKLNVIYIKSDGEFHEYDKRITEHLDKFKLILVNRNVRKGHITLEDYDNFLNDRKEISYIMNASSMKKRNYYCLSYARNGKDTFEKLKLVNSRRSKSNIFALENRGLYEQSDIVVTTLKEIENNPFTVYYLLGLLNSKLYYHWFYHFGKRKGETLELFQKPITEARIKIPSDIERNIVETLVRLIIYQVKENNDSSFLEKTLNGFILEIHYPEEFKKIGISIYDELAVILDLNMKDSGFNYAAAEPEPPLYSNVLSKLKKCSSLIEKLYLSESDLINSILIR